MIFAQVIICIGLLIITTFIIMKFKYIEHFDMGTDCNHCCINNDSKTDCNQNCYQNGVVCDCCRKYE